MSAIRDTERKTRISVYPGIETPEPGEVIFIEVEHRDGDVDGTVLIGPQALPRVIKALQSFLPKAEGPGAGRRER